VSGARYYAKLRERQRDAQIKAMRRCKACYGTGLVPIGGAAWGTVARDVKCEACKGTGCASPPQ
jgi:DnaJ-class molecular chaperone